MTVKSKFSIVFDYDTFVLIKDEGEDHHMSVTNDADNIIPYLNRTLKGGLRIRQLYYIDSMGTLSELTYIKDTFTGFKPCPPHILEAFETLLKRN